MDNFRILIEKGASAVELMAVAIIVGLCLWASVRFLLHTGRHAKYPYERYKLLLSKTLSLGLEFLVAADVIRTVILPPTLRNAADSYFSELVFRCGDGRPLALAVSGHRTFPNSGLRGEGPSWKVLSRVSRKT
jgi:uncharacterized membrane protein